MSDMEKTSHAEKPPTVISDDDDSNQINHHDDDVPDDEAAKVLRAYDGPAEWTATEERQLRNRVDRRLMPVLCLTYGLQYYDKAMLSQAALFGLIPELDLNVGNPTRYSMSASIFYVGFIAGAYPAMLLAQRYPIERVAAGIVTLWGVCLILTPACTTWRALYVERFFLGLLESGVSPLFMLVVGSWYRKNEQAFRMGIWYSMTGYAAIFSPLVNYGLGQIDGALSQWKYMYLFAGAITILWGIIILFVLPPDPVRVKGFNAREKYILVARLRTNNSGVRNTRWKSQQVIELLTDVKFWLAFGVALLAMVSNGAISTFGTIVIKGFGYSSLNSLLLTMPAGAYAGTMMLLLSFLAMRVVHIRTWLIFGAQLGTTFASLLLWKLPKTAKGGLLFAAYILPTTGAGYTVLMGLQIANTAGYTKRSLASSGLYIGYCIGNIIGPLIFLQEEAPHYQTGFIVTFVTALLAGLLALACRFVYMWDNRQRERGGWTEGFDHAYEDPTDKENKQFRYIL